MNLALYTENFLWKGKFKNATKKILRRESRGPSMVSQGLDRGLRSLGIPFTMDQNPVGRSVAGVLNGIDVLRWTIAQKQQGNIPKLLAGPNLVVLPRDSEGILNSPEIDAIIVPSEWVQVAYIKDNLLLTNKIFVWAAGINVPEIHDKAKAYDFLVFNKAGDFSYASDVLQVLTKSGFRSKLISYGSFKQEQYFDLLDNSHALIYLGKSESQGIAMFEAWARGVPTLVHGPHDPSGKIPSPSPYQTDQTGMFFENLDQLKDLTPTFLQTKFSPRQYIEKNFTYAKSAEKYLEIAKQVLTN